MPLSQGPGRPHSSVPMAVLGLWAKLALCPGPGAAQSSLPVLGRHLEMPVQGLWTSLRNLCLLRKKQFVAHPVAAADSIRERGSGREGAVAAPQVTSLSWRRVLTHSLVCELGPAGCWNRCRVLPLPRRQHNTLGFPSPTPGAQQSLGASLSLVFVWAGGRAGRAIRQT